MGFKSFAQKSRLSFESSITAIVGPNGSGKSNTAEAFRFVLGEQGSKSMRIKKSTDLIWGGSHTLPRGSRAGVKIVLDNSQHKLNVDFEEVIIERSVLRDGTNEYSINDARVRLKDVQDLLAGANIGSSGHHIISQGEADRVLGASPKERRDMFEDALGLKAYQLKKTEANRKLETTAINLEKAESRRRELLPHLKFLSRQVDRVEQAQQIRERLKEQAQVYFSSEEQWIAHEDVALQGLMPLPSAEIKKVEDVIIEIRNAIEQASTDDVHANINEQEVTIVKNRLIKLRSTLALLRTELGKVAGQLQMLAVVEQKTKDLPSTISRSKVKELLDEIVSTLGASGAGFAQVRELVERFIQGELTEQRTEKKEDSSLVQERLSLGKVERELLEQVSGQEQAIAKQETCVAEAQALQSKEAQQETLYERDLYKATAEYNILKATLADLGRRQENVAQRRQSLVDNIGEVQILIGEEVRGIGSRIVEQSGGVVPTHRDIERLKIQLEQHGTLGTEVVEEYKEARERHDFLNQEIADLQDAASKLSELITELDARMHEQFTDGLALINREFNTFFTTLFEGGSARLTLRELSHSSVDEDQEGSQRREKQYGVDVQVHLPRKKITTLETLSGGERALVSIALIFAMSQINPPPFIILDETDAALDEANSQRYAKIVQQLSGRSQIILITHNRATMASADTLYGVTMGSDGVSKLLSVKFADAEQFAQ